MIKMNEEVKYCKFCDKEKPKKDFCKSGSFTKNICRECQRKKQTKIYHDSKKVEQLQNNWNELNKFIDENLKSLEEKATNKISDNTVAICGSEMNGFFKVRRKMQELEQGKDE